MAWTLLRAAPPADDLGREEPPAQIATLAPDEITFPERGTAAVTGAEDAWVVMGGPTRALYQAGILERLLERLAPPRVVYGAGIGAVNAVFSANASGLRVREGWESLRALHFLTDIALTSLPLVGASFAATSSRHRMLASLPEAKAARVPDGPTEVVLVASDGSMIALAQVEIGALDATVEGVLDQPRLDSELIARAIGDAVTRGLRRVLLLGAGEGDASGMLGAQIGRARKQGIDVVTLPYLPSSPPSWIDFLLPATGAVDRTIRDGRRAADRWLADQSELDPDAGDSVASEAGPDESPDGSPAG